MNITFKASANYIVREGDIIDLVLEVQGESTEDIMVTVRFTSITAESEWKVFLHGNMLCNLRFPVDFVYGLDASTHLLQVTTTVIAPEMSQFQLMQGKSRYL